MIKKDLSIMENRYLILIVLYNCNLKNSTTIKSLDSCEDILHTSKVVFWDNSLESQFYEEMSSDFSFEFDYIHTPQNLYLSKIYNNIIQRYSDFNYLIILDQDSIFSIEYFYKIQNASQVNKNINLFLPIIKSHNIIVSPGDYHGYKGAYWKKEMHGKINAKNIIAINSGMVINFDYLKNKFKGYDERLKFYGVDTYFMFQYKTKNKYCYVLDYSFSHDSSLLDQKELFEKKYFRLKDLIYSWKITNDYNRIRLLLIKIYAFYFILKTTIKYKNIKYLRLIIDR